MIGNTLSKLPPLNTPASKSGRRSWARQSPPAKAILPVVEVKKAMKLLKGAGKSLAAIEIMPGGGFRVVASSPASTTPKEPPNPFDKLIK